MPQDLTRSAQTTNGPSPSWLTKAWKASTAATYGSTLLALSLWVALISIAVVWGNSLIESGQRLQIETPPLTGLREWRIGVRVLPAIAVAITIVIAGPRLATTLSWRSLLLVGALSSAAWAVALAIVDGWSGLTQPLIEGGQYLRTVSRVGSPFNFLDHFTQRIESYNTHTQGHPPGMVLVLWALDRIGLGGARWNAVLVIGGGAASIPAALVTLREVAGEAAARAAAPFLALAPAAIWWSSGDALFAGVAAWAVALVVLATGCTGKRSDALALGGGLLFAATAFLSYGLVLLAIVPVVVAQQRRRMRPLLMAVLGGLAMMFAFLVAGFSWFDGLGATRRQYLAGVASRRPYVYFLVANLAAFALALGPATAVALARLRGRTTWILVGGGLAAITVANLSGMSKGEVERIWLPFAPWILIACATLGLRAGRVRATTGWLGLQAATALVLETAIRSKW